jgi:hypothetical protein
LAVISTIANITILVNVDCKWGLGTGNKIVATIRTFDKSRSGTSISETCVQSEVVQLCGRVTDASHVLWVV